MMAGGLALLGAVTGSFSSWMLQAFRREDEEAPREVRLPGAPPRLRGDHDHTWTRRSTTSTSFASAWSRGTPFSCEPSR